MILYTNLKITLQIHRRSGFNGNELILQLDQLPQLRVLLEPISQSYVADEILGTLAGVYEVLAVVVVRV